MRRAQALFALCSRAPRSSCSACTASCRGEVSPRAATLVSKTDAMPILASIDCGSFLTPAHKPAEPLVKLLRNRVD